MASNIVLATEKFNVVGTRPIRHDGTEKVTGQAQYGADIHLPGMLHGRILRSPHAHARIKGIDPSRALALPGVMAVVTAALVVGSTGRTAISPETWHPLTETWEQLGFWANSLIFVLVGLAVPTIMADVSMTDVGLLVVLLLAAFVARAAILYGLLPVFGLTGLSAKVSTEYTTVMFWGGLRGAVSLALALAIHENPALPEETRSFVVVLVTGFVLFTLFINAPTMNPLMSWLGLDKLSAADLDVRNRVLAQALSGVRDDIHDVARDYQIEPELAGKIAGRYDERMAAIEAERSGSDTLSADDRARTGLTTLINDERALYLKQFNQGFVSPAIARRLFAQADTILDGVKTGGIEGHNTAVHKVMGFSHGFRLAEFQNPASVAEDRVAILWGWSHDGDWSAPSNPRVEFAGQPCLNKLYVTWNRGRDNRPLDETVPSGFLAAFLPVARNAFPAKN